MKRRNFFKSTALGSSALALSGLTACSAATEKEPADVDYSSFPLNEVTIR